VRKRLGNFIVAEDDQTLEGVILGRLLAGGSTLAIAETVTGGHLAARIAPLPGAERAFRRGTIARDLSELGATAVAPDQAASVAKALRASSGASHALVVLLELDEGADRPDMGGTICIGLADASGAVTRQARLVGGRDWVRIGATELGLDCLRRHLLGLPVDERIDFERR
jgi:nicotinamide-nucleotide amidase